MKSEEGSRDSRALAVKLSPVPCPHGTGASDGRCGPKGTQGSDEAASPGEHRQANNRGGAGSDEPRRVEHEGEDPDHPHPQRARKLTLVA